MIGTLQPKLAEGGSLTMLSAQLKHSGVHQLVAKAVNPAGRVEKELSLESESEEANNIPIYDTVPFKDEYDVRLYSTVLW